MKGNIIQEMRKVVTTLYDEGHDEIFAISILQDNGKVLVQVCDFDLEPKDLSSEYKKTYNQANRTLHLAKDRYGVSCKAINSLICDEIKEVVSFSNDVLRIDYLNV